MGFLVFSVRLIRKVGFTNLASGWTLVAMIQHLPPSLAAFYTQIFVCIARRE